LERNKGTFIGKSRQHLIYKPVLHEEGEDGREYGKDLCNNCLDKRNTGLVLEKIGRVNLV